LWRIYLTPIAQKYSAKELRRGPKKLSMARKNAGRRIVKTFSKMAENRQENIFSII
jgi:hypothetical protein